jgi:flagellar hook-length control protein FliK
VTMPLLSGPVTARISAEAPERTGTKDEPTSEFQDLLAAMAGVVVALRLVPVHGGEAAVPTVPGAAGTAGGAAPTPGGIATSRPAGPLTPVATGPVPAAGPEVGAPTTADGVLRAAASAPTGAELPAGAPASGESTAEPVVSAATEVPVASTATEVAVAGGPTAEPAGPVAAQADLPPVAAGSTSGARAGSMPQDGATEPGIPARPDGVAPAAQDQGNREGTGEGTVSEPLPADPPPGTGAPEPPHPPGQGELPATVDGQPVVAAPPPAQLGTGGTTSTERAAPPAPAQQLAAEIVPLRDKPGEHTLTVSLHPVDLGPVTVTARVQGSDIHLDLGSATEAGREALRSALPELRRELERAGFTSTLLDTSSGGSSQERGAPWEQAPRHAPIQEPVRTTPEPARPGTTTGVLDLHA